MGLATENTLSETELSLLAFTLEADPFALQMIDSPTDGISKGPLSLSRCLMTFQRYLLSFTCQLLFPVFVTSLPARKRKNLSRFFQQPIIGPANLTQDINLVTLDEAIAKISLLFPKSPYLTNR